MLGKRIVIAGASGSGKTTLAERIAAVTGIPHTEIDGMYWRAGWTANERFVDDVEALAAGDRWVTEFQYREAMPILATWADLLVWVRPPRMVVLAGVVARTLRRRLRRELLWGVTVEPPLQTIFTDRDHVVRYSMRTFRAVEDRIRLARHTNPALRLVHVRTARDAARVVRLLAKEPRR